MLIEESKAFDATSLLEAVRAGHCYIGFDFLGDSWGFSFEAENGEGGRSRATRLYYGKGPG